MTGSQNVIKMTTKTMTANGLTIHLRRYGKICVVTCNDGSLSRNVTAGDAFAVMPEDFKPYAWQPFPDQATGTTGNPTSNAFYSISSSSGSLTANKDMVMGAHVRFTVTYTALN